jgi:hypothetical protein
MRTAALLLFLAIASGCSHTHTAINVAAGTGTGATVTGGSVSVQGHSHSLAALVVAGMFMAAAIDYSRAPHPFPSFSGFADWFRGAPPPPELDAERRVLEHDCTQPLPEFSGNLKCR